MRSFAAEPIKITPIRINAPRTAPAFIERGICQISPCRTLDCPDLPKVTDCKSARTTREVVDVPQLGELKMPAQYWRHRGSAFPPDPMLRKASTCQSTGS